MNVIDIFIRNNKAVIIFINFSNMLPPHLAKVPVFSKLIPSKMQKPETRKKSLVTVNSPAPSSMTLMKGIAIDGALKLPVLLNIFPIQFIYLQKLIATKVMKVDYRYSDPFYKVVVTSLMHNSASLWWIQLQPEGWVVLLGPRPEEKLKWAIISEIECHELLFSI
jgi:hypothetical protein